MKKILQVIAVLAALSVMGGVYAQTGADGSNAKGTQFMLQKYPNVESKVVSLGGTEKTTVATTGRGILVGVDITSADSTGNQASVPFSIAFFDQGTTNNLVTGGTGVFNVKKIIADVSTLQNPSSAGGPTVSVGNVSLQYQHPVTFEKGIVILNNSSATKGNVAVYWIK